MYRHACTGWLTTFSSHRGKAVPHRDGPGRLKCVSGPSLNACWCIRARKVVPWDGVRCHSIYLSNQSLELDKILQMVDLKILIIVTLWTVSFSSIKSHSQDSGVASLPLGGVLTPSDGTIQGWQRMLARTASYNSSSQRMMFVVIKTWSSAKNRKKNCLISGKTLLFPGPNQSKATASRINNRISYYANW